MRGAASIGDAVALRSSGNERLGSVWSVLREILLGFSFAEMKTLTASAGLPTGKLSHLRQTSGSGRSTGKGELADAIDGLFNELDAVDQDRVTANLITELLRRRSADEERLTELLERVGWTLIGDQPSPPRRATGSAAGTGRGGLALATAARRYRDGDLDGAIDGDRRDRRLYYGGDLHCPRARSPQANGLPRARDRSAQGAGNGLPRGTRRDGRRRSRADVEGARARGQRSR